MNYYTRQERSFHYLDVVRRLFQVVLFGFMAAPVAYLGVWQSSPTCGRQNASRRTERGALSHRGPWGLESPNSVVTLG